MMLLKLLMISTFERVPLLVANVANVQEPLVVVRFANYALAGFFSTQAGKRAGALNSLVRCGFDIFCAPIYISPQFEAQRY